MIPFEKAKALKEGDLVFDGNFAAKVVKIKVDKKAKTVAITYTDGSPDDFDAGNERLSLTREGEAEPAQPQAPAQPKPKKAMARLTALPKPTDSPLDRLKTGAIRNIEWRSLEYFEEDRMEIVKAISSKLGIPESEFEDTPQTAQFHFMSLAVAIAKWLDKSGWEEIHNRDFKDMNQLEMLARSKIMAGILVRLFGHAFVQNLGETPGLGQMVKAFSLATGVREAMIGHVLTAHIYVRQSTLLMARFFADGQEGGSPVTVDFFDPYGEHLEGDGDGFMPIDAVIDASVQLYCAMKYIHGQADMPASLESLPESEPHAHNFLRNYLMLAGMFRTPATVQFGKLSFKAATLDNALESLGDEKPLVLLDAVFTGADGSVELVVPLNPLTKNPDTGVLAGLIGKECQKLASKPSIKMAMFPLM